MANKTYLTKEYDKLPLWLRVLIQVVAGVVAGAYFLIKKISDKKKAEADNEENYVSCSCCEA